MYTTNITCLNFNTNAFVMERLYPKTVNKTFFSHKIMCYNQLSCMYIMSLFIKNKCEITKKFFTVAVIARLPRKTDLKPFSLKSAQL